MKRYVGGIRVSYTFLVLSLFVVGCAQNKTASLPTPSSRYSAETTGYSPVVLVVLPGADAICSGTFVSEKAVLTAAHCALQDGRYEIIASFGDFSTYTHIKLGPGIVDDPSDIALLIFDTPVASRAQGQVYDMGGAVHEGDQLRLVGYGCNNIDDHSGAGVKRTATNVVYQIGDYVEFQSPDTADSSARGIGGPDNVAYSCPGDSGGPALAVVGNVMKVVAVTHAGGVSGNIVMSEYVNVATQSANRAFLNQVNNTYNLGIRGI